MYQFAGEDENGEALMPPYEELKGWAVSIQGVG